MKYNKLKNLFPILIILLGFSIHCTSPIVQSKIQPPIAELAPFAKIYSFCADETTQITTENATIITIPANALVDSLGNIVFGEVDLHYLELLDIAEIFTSGIPMEVKDEMMSSGGMFDIQAYQNDQKLYLQQDKAIAIQMPSAQDSVAYPIWKYNKVNNEWITQEDALEYATNPEKEALLAKKELLNPPLKIPLSSENFCFNYATLIDVHYGKYNSKATTDVLKKAASYGFTFSQFNNSTRVFYYGKTFPANMLLWKNLSSQKIPNNGNNYNASLALKEGTKHNYLLLIHSSKDTLFNGTIQVVMPLAHLYKYSPENWALNYDKYLKEMEDVQAEIDATENFVTLAQVESFGIYNYDFLIRNENAKWFNASFLLPDGRKPEEIFYMVKTQKIMARYPLNTWNKFRILNALDDLIVAVDKNRKAYVYYPNQQDFNQSDSTQVFQLHRSPVIINQVADIDLLFQDELVTKAF